MNLTPDEMDEIPLMAYVYRWVTGWQMLLPLILKKEEIHAK